MKPKYIKYKNPVFLQTLDEVRNSLPYGIFNSLVYQLSKSYITKAALIACGLILGLKVSSQTPSIIPDDLELNIYNDQTEIKALNSIKLTNGFYVPAGSNVTIGISQFPSFSSKPTGARNYILTRTFRIPGVTAQTLNQPRNIGDENQTVQYFDGLGRNIQRVELMASPTYKDIVQYQEFDIYGRESIKYLPHVKNATGDGAYSPDARIDQMIYYARNGSWDQQGVKTDFPYAVTIFENSPASRVLEQGAPGNGWQPVIMGVPGGGHSVRSDYGSNVETATEMVKLWTVDYNAQGIPTGAKGTGKFTKGKLSRITVKDENWVSGKAGTVDEYRDSENRIVLKRIWNTNPQTKAEYPLDTYYIYGNFGNLYYVVPPAVTATSFTELATDPNFDKYIYAYRYDGRKRVVKKKVPGKGWDYLVYNNNDKVVFTRDAEQLKKNEWSFFKYDVFGKIVLTGVETGHMGDDHEDLQKALAEFTGPNWENRGTVLEGYTNNTIPQNTNNITVNQVNYYDSYDNIPGIPFTAHASYSKMLKTLPTVTKSRVLGTTTWLWTVNHYDNDGRITNIQSTNHIGGKDEITNTYNFPGELVKSVRVHTPKTGGSTTIVTNNTYDHIGRLTSSKEKIGEQAEVTLASNSYNEIGQLNTKFMGKLTTEPGYVDTTIYTYNERGWLSKSISPRFSQQLKYQDGTTPQWNGNISQQLWNDNEKLDATAKGFTYSYDKIGRLTGGTNGLSGTAGIAEVLEYDDMGNIKTLKRDALAVTAYTYNGNRLTGLTGGVSGNYTYFDNGSVKTDRMGMSFSYNYLNLPQVVSKAGVNITFLYDGSGAKLQKLSTIGATNPVKTTRDYVDGIEYNNGVIDIIHNSVGYALKSGNNYIYHYNLTDHLGNVRATLKRGSSVKIVDIVQRDNYYPFGKRKVVAGGNNKYLYNGKEIQDELGGQYDYRSRFYDAEIGRWNVVDPMAEKMRRHSPYNYAFDNPVRFIDPDGMEPFDWVRTNGGSVLYDSRVIDQQTATELYGGKYLPVGFKYTSSAGNNIELGEHGFFKSNQEVFNSPDLGEAEIMSGPVDHSGAIMKGGLVLAGGMLMDDITVIGIGDDIAIPGVLLAAGAGSILGKMSYELDKIRARRNAGPEGFQYALVANASGDYPIFTRGSASETGKQSLKQGEVWKYGETTSSDRYSTDYLNSIGKGLIMERQFYGNQMQIKVAEKIKIYNYFLINGQLPPGNKIFR
ncbi:DUF6443 domain-containing protein [Chryseobacterium angstadtii]|nr:DUF6443 domain-containing protein [Chryseobacterium angstadtii]